MKVELSHTGTCFEGHPYICPLFPGDIRCGWLVRKVDEDATLDPGLWRWRPAHTQATAFNSEKEFLAALSEPMPQAEALAAMYAVYRLTAGGA